MCEANDTWRAGHELNVGFPAISSALAATIEVLRERGLDGGVKTAEESGIL